MEDQSHDKIYDKLSQVHTDVQLVKKEVCHVKEQVEMQNGRVKNNEISVKELHQTGQRLIHEIKSLSKSETEREKARKSLRMWFVDNTSTVATGLLLAYLMLKFGF